ncbi:glycosyltransferase 87 family protein [Kitasatospora sp. NPDC058965]|uniref:glycosyltransferase 87 family protein n=1 Tax=Kitasatospora sp. NPDC058965 TaxID=3346682 RepID=UPI0036A95CFF
MVTTRSSGAPRARGRFGVRRGTPTAAGPTARHPGGHPSGHRPGAADGSSREHEARPVRPRTGVPHQRPATRTSEPQTRWARLTALVSQVADHRLVHLFGCLVAAGWAAAFPLVSNLPNQQLWGEVAAPAYLLAGLTVVTLPRRLAGRVAAAIALLGAVLLPLGVLAAQGRHQSEVMVVERSARLLLHTGTPYLPHPTAVTDFNPYLPSMAVFGLPRAVLGDATVAAQVLGDARIWFALTFLGCLTVSWRLLRPGPQYSPLLPLGILTGSPLIALTLAVGGVDLPLIGVCCLAMALAARERTVAAGLVLALACTLKWTAWPALPVAVLLLWRVHGRRSAARAALTALLVGGAVILPYLLTRPQDLKEQVVRFPLGLAKVHTPAGSPLPGKVLADLGPTGHTLSIVLLVLGGLAVTAWLLWRPPTTAVAAADLLAAGLTVAFMLAPAGRFGYLALPAVLALWPRLAARRWSGRTAEDPLTVEGVRVVATR